MLTRRLGLPLVLAVTLLLAGCGRPAEPPEFRHRFMAMGTLVEFTAWDLPEAEAQAAVRELETLFATLQHEWDPWGDGEMGRLNRRLEAGEEAVAESADLASLLAEAERLRRDSGGLFDPQLGLLVRLWGFHQSETRLSAPPPRARIEAVLAPDTPRLYDLGGFLKGVAVDRGMALLRDRGVENALLNAGGDLRAIGRRGPRAWRIGIRDPRDAGQVLAAIEVADDEAVFTSGDYERWFDYQGRRYHHVLDPRSGEPTRGISSVTVLHEDGGRADAAATALMVAGPEHWPATAAALGVAAVLVVREDGAVELSEAMQTRIWFTDRALDEAARVRSLP